MGLPSINVEFTKAASTAFKRSEKGTVAVILRDAAENGGFTLTAASQIPAALSVDSKAYLATAFLGYVNPPKKVVVFVEPADATDLTAGLAYMATQSFDYLVGPPDISVAECTAVVAWIKAQREDGKTPKAVLPDTAAGYEGIVNFSASGIKAGAATYSAAQYCARMAGLLAGTPITISCTFAPLPEVSDIDRLTTAALDAAIDAGKLVLYYDGEKVVCGRGVNSLIKPTEEQGAEYKKIKIIEAIDLMQGDIKRIGRNTFIGKYPNSYDNKCVLVTAIHDYLTGLELAGILKTGSSSVGIDVDATEAYLQSTGVDTSTMSAQDIKTANTGASVFLAATVSILDAIEDITVKVTF